MQKLILFLPVFLLKLNFV